MFCVCEKDIKTLIKMDDLKDKSKWVNGWIGKEEEKTNIFLRCKEPSIKNALNLNNASEQEIFSKLRDLKDSF